MEDTQSLNKYYKTKLKEPKERNGIDQFVEIRKSNEATRHLRKFLFFAFLIIVCMIVMGDKVKKVQGESKNTSQTVQVKTIISDGQVEVSVETITKISEETSTQETQQISNSDNGSGQQAEANVQAAQPIQTNEKIEIIINLDIKQTTKTVALQETTEENIEQTEI